MRRVENDPKFVKNLTVYFTNMTRLGAYVNWIFQIDDYFKDNNNLRKKIIIHIKLRNANNSFENIP